MKVNKYIQIEETRQKWSNQRKKTTTILKNEKLNKNNFLKNDSQDDGQIGYGRTKQYIALNAKYTNILT